MSKKKNKDDELDDLQLDEDSIPREDVPDEQDDSEDSDQDDVFAEDESDIAMMHSLEAEDTKQALSEFSFAEEIGFNPMLDSAAIAEVELSRYQTLMSLDAEAVKNYSWKRLNSFQKWMVARACSKNGLHDMFREICQSLIKMRKPAPELCVEDIYLEIVWDYIETKEYAEAAAMLDRFEQDFPDEKSAALRVRGLMMIDQGEVEKGKDLIAKIHNLPFNRNIKGFEADTSGSTGRMDGIIQYEIGYSLMSMKHYDLAMHYFDRARSLANMNDNYELTMAIENACAMVQKCIHQDD